MTTTAKKENKHDRMYREIKHHGEALNGIFNTGIDPIKLSKLVLRIERVAHKLATDYCNGADGINSDNVDIYTETILKRLDRLIDWHTSGVPVFINLDARGYALKIETEYMEKHNLNLHKDWGGYGILAPDFSRD